MRTIVLKIKEDIMQANGKTEANVADLLKVMTHYGVIENYETATAKERAEWQSTIDNLTKQIADIKEQELTVDEIKMVKSYRENKSSVVSAYVAEAENYKSQLQAVKTEHEQRVAKLKAILGDD